MTDAEQGEKNRLRTFFGELVQFGNVVAVGAVVVSVLYLNKYIEENTKALRSQAHFNGVMLGQRPIEMTL